MFLALTRFIHHHLLWFLIGAYAISATWPTAGLWIRNLTFGDVWIFHEKLHVSLLLLLLATLMFNAGLGVKTSHLTSLAQKTRVLFAGLTANLIIPMVYIFLITLIMRLWHNPVEAQHILVGLALVAAMPIAGASTAWAQNSNGNLALSLGLVLASTLWMTLPETCRHAHTSSSLLSSKISSPTSLLSRAFSRCRRASRFVR